MQKLCKPYVITPDAASKVFTSIPFPYPFMGTPYVGDSPPMVLK